MAQIEFLIFMVYTVDVRPYTHTRTNDNGYFAFTDCTLQILQ